MILYYGCSVWYIEMEGESSFANQQVMSKKKEITKKVSIYISCL